MYKSPRNKKALGFLMTPYFWLIVIILGISGYGLLKLGSDGLLAFSLFSGIIYDDFQDDSLESNCVNNICENQYSKVLGKKPIVQDGILTLTSSSNYITTKSGNGFLGNDFEFSVEYEFIESDKNTGDIYQTGLGRVNSVAVGEFHIYIQDQRLKLPTTEDYLCNALDCRGNVKQFVIIRGLFDDPTDFNSLLIEANGQEQRLMLDKSKPIQIRIETIKDPNTYGVVAKIRPIRYNLPFNCDIEDDEIVMTQRFIALNNPVDITFEDLTYDVQNFCLERSPIIRDLPSNGEREDSRGTILQKLEIRQPVTIQPQQVVEIQYITDFSPDKVPPCPEDSAFSKELNKCYKFIEEKEDIIEIIRDVEFITIGENSHIFTTPNNIGDIQITASTPVFICDPGKDQNAPNPSKDCWRTSLNFGGKEYLFNYGQEIKVNPYITLQWLPEAHFESEIGEVDEFSNKWKLILFDRMFVRTDVISNDNLNDYFILQGESQTMKIKVDQNLANFNENQAGYKLTTQSGLVKKQRTQLINKASVQDYVLENVIAGDELGEVETRVQLYFDIAGKKYFDDSINIQNNRVVTEIPTDVIFKEKTIIKEVIVERPVSFCRSFTLCRNIVDFISDLFK